MSSEYGYEFFMQECDNKGDAIEGSTQKNLEKDFAGLRYSKIEGIEQIGKAKNIYSETYADADRLRVHVPPTIQNDATTVTLTLYFVGDDRFASLDAFNAYVRDGFHRYWDSARNKWFAFYIQDELKPAEQMWYGTTPYLKMEYPLKNIFGRTFDL